MAKTGVILIGLAAIIAVLAGIYYVFKKKDDAKEPATPEKTLSILPIDSSTVTIGSDAPAISQIIPNLTVVQGNRIMPLPDEIPPGTYVDAANVIHLPVTDISQTALPDNPELGTVNVGLVSTGGSFYESPLLSSLGIPNDFSWVSPELRATNIDPAILHQAPTQNMSSNWVVTVGDDGRAYARDIARNGDKTVYIATPQGWRAGI